MTRTHPEPCVAGMIMHFIQSGGTMDRQEEFAGRPATRRSFLSRSALLTGAVATGIVGGATAVPRKRVKPPAKAFCIDFNWGPAGASPPGMYARADPAEHVRWYRDLGADTIQTFCVSYNGYAWFPSEVAPVTPGLKVPDFLGEMVRLGHREGMRVMGYFTLGANPYWEERNPDLVHGAEADYIKIPFTLEYLDYFCRSVEDTLRKTGVDGFMIDWVRPAKHERWLDCEREMYRQLLGERFPASGAPSTELMLEYDRRAIDRAWRHISRTVKAVRPAVIWTNHPILKEEYPLWEGHRLLREVDWILNEGPDLAHLEWLGRQVGPKTLIVQNLCGWGDHDASAWEKVDVSRFGLYGFAKADEKTTLPDAGVPANIRNIEILRKAYHAL